MNIAVVPLTMDSYDEVFALWQQREEIGLSEADSREGIRTYLQRNPNVHR